MESLRTHRAFTLIEMLIVLSLLTMLAGCSVIAGSDSYQRALAANDLERRVSALRQARSFAQANAISLAPAEVIFLPRSGEVSTEKELFVTDGNGRSRSIVVEKSGRIRIEPF